MTEDNKLIVERKKKLDEKNTNWSKPMDSVIPYHNIDLEIWNPTLDQAPDVRLRH